MKTNTATERGATRGQQCIWMEAGVINYKLCTYDYACGLCPFDKAMRQSSKVDQGDSLRIPWTDMLREKAGPERYCRHMLQGMTSYKLCPNNYDCGNCQYDQMIQDTIGDAMIPVLRQVAGFSIPPAHHFHRKHAWAHVEYGGKCRIGFDDFGTRVLGRDHVFVLPKLGQQVKQNEPFMTVKAAEREFELESPVDGVVTAVNPLQEFADELAPYTDGWIAFVEPTRRMPANLKKLAYGDDAVEWLSESVDKLVESLSSGTALAADGGVIVPELYTSLPPETRAGLIETVVLGG